jgi:hypothetical protein
MQNPISGGFRINCKTPNCKNGFCGDFVFSLTEWVENFPNQKLRCTECKKIHDYSRNDIIPVPSKVPAEAEKEAEKNEE